MAVLVESPKQLQNALLKMEEEACMFYGKRLKFKILAEPLYALATKLLKPLQVSIISVAH